MPHCGPAGGRVDHLLVGDRDKLAALQGDDGVVAARQQVSHRRFAQAACVLDVEAAGRAWFLQDTISLSKSVANRLNPGWG